MDWDRVNIWTNTLYTLIQSLHIAKEISFGDLTSLHDRAKESANWVTPDCSYSSVLLAHEGGNDRLTFRRDPNKHFNEISRQVIKMLLQDLVVILDDMMTEALESRGESAGDYPMSKIQKLGKGLDPKFEWAKNGCFELVAVRNVLTHSAGKWNIKTIDMIESFISPLPKAGESLSVGFTMLFRYRKAMRTFLNEVSPAS